MGFGFFGEQIIAIMTTAETVRDAAGSYLPWMVAAPIIGFAAWILDGIFIGATRTRDMRNMMLVSAAVYAVSAAVLVPWFGNTGLWTALLISFVIRALTLGSRYPALEAEVELN
jgi:MATE family multidrug resistance protein